MCEDKIEALDRIGAASGDDRAAKLYLSVSTSDAYDIETRQYAARLLRHAFPEATELQDAVVAVAVQFAADKGAEEALRLDFLEVILFSQRTYNTVKALVTLMADADDSPDVRRTAWASPRKVDTE